MDLSIIILNYKQKGLVKQCLKGILAAAINLNYEIIVVDNDSGDDCLKMVKEQFLGIENNYSSDKTQTKEWSMPKQKTIFLKQELKQKLDIKTIQAKKNLGFAAGNNLGIKIAQGKYILILNPDIAIVSNVLEKMFEFMENYPKVGVCGPKLINPDGSVQYSRRRFPSWRIPLYRRTFLGKLPFAKKTLNYYLMTEKNHNNNQKVDWLFGACLMIRKKVIDQIGAFDERFFMYFEDLDLCRRIWQTGFEVYYLAEVEMIHYHQRLSAEKSGLFGLFNKAARIHLSSGIKYFAKYLGVKSPR